MIPVFQNKHSAVDGDCFEACLASIMEIRIETIPAFTLNNPDDWWDKVVEWAASQKYSAVWLTNNPPVMPIGFHIASCDRQQSVHGEIAHAVVAKDGIPVHCPTHGDKPRTVTGIHDWFLLIPYGRQLRLAS